MTKSQKFILWEIVMTKHQDRSKRKLKNLASNYSLIDRALNSKILGLGDFGFWVFNALDKNPIKPVDFEISFQENKTYLSQSLSS